jgi:hypothetical protein
MELSVEEVEEVEVTADPPKGSGAAGRKLLQNRIAALPARFASSSNFLPRQPAASRMFSRAQ